MKTGLIYKATNIKTGKSYIGQTIGSLKDRIINHYSSAKRYDYKFYRALKKYSKNLWAWDEICNNIPEECLNKLEKDYIKIYNSYDNGYNSTKGGGYNPIRGYNLSKTIKGKKRKYMIEYNKLNKTGIKLSTAHKNKISNALKGSKRSENTKIKISIAQKGKIKSKEHRENISKSHMGKKMAINIRETMKGNERRAQNYMIIDPNGNEKTITNLTKYCKANNLNSQHMSSVACGKRGHHKNYKCVKV